MELRQALEGSDLADIQAKTAALEDASRGLADVLYAQAQAAQSSTQSSGNGGGAQDDEVVEDADYEVIDEEEATKS
jgi:molecular chaperone DnaK